MGRPARLATGRRARVVGMLAGMVVHTKANFGCEQLNITTASGPLRNELTDPDNPLAQHFRLPPDTTVLYETGVPGVWNQA